jgi:carboxyl-terminal processing protease
MTFARLRNGLGWCLLLAVAAVAWADESLNTAYTAILRGDYAAGRATVTRLLKQGQPPEQARRIRNWLDSYQQIVSSREELRQKTFDWNVEHAKEQLEKGDLYLALSFAAQATAYAADEAEYAASPWVQELRRQALAAAAEHAKNGKWAKAHAFYLLLSRIDEEDKEVEELREQAERHARLEVVYKDEEDLQRRLEGVGYHILHRALKLIDEKYYTDPDFGRMAEGALDNLVALCTTTRLYEGPDAAGEFDGVADPVAREYFLNKLVQERRQLEDAGAYGYKDLISLYNTVKEANEASVSLPKELLIVEYTEGALGALDDFTSVVWPSDSDEFDKMMVGNFVGVGIQLGVDEITGRLKVVTPLENSPALESGIQPGDLIIGVDGESTRGWTTEQAVREITGEAGTQVTLTMYRPGSGRKIDFELTRRPIELTTVRGVKRLGNGNGNVWDFMLEKDAGIAYIRLTNFNPGSASELEQALTEAKKQGMRGLILDVRHNPGGLLEVAIATVSTFLDEGLVVKTEGAHETAQELPVTGDAPFGDLPLVVLVNELSASASEILAGALRDHGRALVLGERSFGKGMVQRVYGLERTFSFMRSKPEARLKLTTALYYLPNGETPQKLPEAKEWGVLPDRVVDLTPKEFSKVLEQQRNTFIIHNEAEPEEAADEEMREQELAKLKADEEEESEREELLSEEDIELLRSDPLEAPEVDPQLQTALLHLRVKLAANLPWPRQLAKKTEDNPR